MPELKQQKQPKVAPRPAQEPERRPGPSLRGMSYAEGAAQVKPGPRPPDPDGLMRPDFDAPTAGDDLMRPDFDQPKDDADGVMRPDFSAPKATGKKPPARPAAEVVKENKRRLACIDDLMSYGAFDWAITDGEATRALSLLAGAGDAALPALVQHLDKGKALSRLLENLPRKAVEANALSVLKLFKHRTRKGADKVREIAIRATELQGKDPDALLGNYTQTRWAYASYDEQLAERDDAGNWIAKTYTGHKSYTIGITDREVVVSVAIRLGADAALADKMQKIKARWLDGIKEKWNGKFRASNGVTTLPIRFRPLFLADADTETVADHDVKVKAGSGRANAGKFYEKSTKGTAAHEFGHMIGNVDEYDQPVYDKDHKVTGGKDEHDSVMSDHGAVHARHFDSVIADLNKMRDPAKPEFKLKPQ
ncbi:MAG: hypothetical protein AMXMBFR64_02400 [Myxococcales bacterium]